MRHCFGEVVEVHEAKARTPGKALKKVGKFLEERNHLGIANVNLYYLEDDDRWYCTVYVHTV